MGRKTEIFFVIILLILVLTIFLIFVFPRIENNYHNSNKTIKVATFAICEQRGDYILCKDKIFASCDKKPIEISEKSFNCNNREYKIEEIPTGEVYHEKNWKDSRQKGFLTSWAILE